MARVYRRAVLGLFMWCDGHASGLGAIHHRPFPMASGEMDGPQFTGFLRTAFQNLVGFSDDGSCCRSRDLAVRVEHDTVGLCIPPSEPGLPSIGRSPTSSL